MSNSEKMICLRCVVVRPNQDINQRRGRTKPFVVILLPGYRIGLDFFTITRQDHHDPLA